MNPGLVVKLRPAGPWRIGPDSGARNRVDVIYHSDSLFSAVTSAMARMGSLSDWLDATARTPTPAVCFSSCFPFLDEIVFVVPPRTMWPPTSPALISARVRWKSARFVPLPMVQAILSGEKLHANQWSVDGASGCLVPAGRGGPFRTSVRWNAAVDRLSGASERHATACIEFRPGAGLWTVVGFADDSARDRWQGPVKAAFRLLADTGFGGERSRGWGRAETPEFIEGSLPEMIIEERGREYKAPIEPAGEVAAREAATEVSTESSGESAGQSAAESVAELAGESGAESAGESVAGPVPELVAGSVPEPGYPKEPSPVPPINDPPSEPRPMREPGEPLPETEPGVPQPETDPEPPPPDPDPEPSGPPILEPVFVRSDSPLEAVLLAPAMTAEMRVRDGSEAAAAGSDDAPREAGQSEANPSRDREGATGEPPSPEEPAPEPELQAAPESHAEPPSPEESVPLPAPESEVQSAPESQAAPESHAEPPASEEPAPQPAPEPELQPAPQSHAEPLLLAAGPRPLGPVLQAHWLLSLFTPAAADTVDWARGSYTVLARGGRVESPSGSGELKKQIQMVAEGSVLYADGVPRGAAADVAPDGFAHPVFRAGFALSIRLPEVH